MLDINRVVVGVDMPESRPWAAANLTPPCRLAVRQAFAVAEGMNVPVELICVLPELTTGLVSSEADVAAAAQELHEEAASVLRDIVSRSTQQSAVETTINVVTGRPWFEILKVAGTQPDTLIVCGTRDQGAVSRFLFGSTGLKLLRNAPGPVWLVKPRIDDDADLDVLAATDLTDVGKEILHASVSLAQTLPVRLNILHVVENEFEHQIARTGTSESELADYRQQAKDRAESAVHNELSMTDYRTVERGVQVHIAEGAADGCILSAISELDIDLLVMATAARGGIPGMLFGNTAERLLPELPCSVLVLKPDDFECPVAVT